jgi:ankyrin repeat protein
MDWKALNLGGGISFHSAFLNIPSITIPNILPTNNKSKKMNPADNNNYAQLAFEDKLTIAEIQHADKKRLDEDVYEGFTVLYHACGKCSVQIVQALLDREVDIDGLSKGHWPPLTSAAGKHKWDNFKLLLDRGANAKYTTKDGWNILHFAAGNGAPVEIINFLLDAGIDVMAVNQGGYSPLDIAKSNQYSGTVSYLEGIINPPVKSANLLI